MTQQQFIESLIPYTNGLVVLPSLFLSQVCKESGFGKHIFYNNMLGIKCHDSKAYAGCRIGKTGEVINGILNPKMRLSFQCYNDIGECAEDYNRIMSLKRYAPVRNSKCYQEATYWIKKCGYATGTNYDTSLRDDYIIPFKLYNYDYRKPYESNLTENFSYSECFSSTIAGKEYFKRAVEPPLEFDTNIIKVAIELQKLRTYYNIPIIVNSWYRTPEYNKTLKDSSKNSMHLKGLAVDVRVPRGVSVYSFFKTATEITNFRGFGIGSNYLHCDLRNGDLTVWTY